MERNKDKQLDVPAEANTEKHINFLEAEGQTSDESDRATQNTKEDDNRRKEWKRGLAEGEREREKK